MTFGAFIKFSLALFSFLFYGRKEATGGLNLSVWQMEMNTDGTPSPQPVRISRTGPRESRSQVFSNKRGTNPGKYSASGALLCQAKSQPLKTGLGWGDPTTG